MVEKSFFKKIIEEMNCKDVKKMPHLNWLEKK